MFSFQFIWFMHGDKNRVNQNFSIFFRLELNPNFSFKGDQLTSKSRPCSFFVLNSRFFKC